MSKSVRPGAAGRLLLFYLVFAIFHAAPGFAQSDPPQDILVKELQDRLDQLQKQADELRQEIEALKKASSPGTPSPSKNPTPTPASSTDTALSDALEQEPAAPLSTSDAPSPAETPMALPTQQEQTPAPITIVSGAGGKNFLNLSFDALMAAGGSTYKDTQFLQTGGHDPNQRGFTLQNAETVMEGAVDPYFRGQANIVLQITPDGGTQVELEEAYATTTSLPKGLQAKAGQFFTEFGRLNPQHPHSWDFVDQPLVNGRFFGPDGLRSTGVRVSWLLPTSFYSEAFVAVQNSQGETAGSFRSVPGESLFGRTVQERPISNVSDLLIVPRYTASFDLSDTQTLLLGASAALGPSGISETGHTRIYGLDGFWKWKASNAFQGFPYVKVQTEIMQRSVDASAVPQQFNAATFQDWGGYFQINWGYKAGHAIGLRIDRVGGDQGASTDGTLAPRLRLSPALTWFPTEFSKLRLQYNFDRSDDLEKSQHSLWLQLEFLLGAHAAHKF